VLKVRVVAPSRDALGFRLAGLAVDTYEGAQDAKGILLRRVADPECGVLLVDESIWPLLDSKTTRQLAESHRPLVVTLPMGAGAVAEKEYLERLIRRVIGYQVRLR